LSQQPWGIFESTFINYTRPFCKASQWSVKTGWSWANQAGLSLLLQINPLAFLFWLDWGAPLYLVLRIWNRMEWVSRCRSKPTETFKEFCVSIMYPYKMILPLWNDTKMSAFKQMPCTFTNKQFLIFSWIALTGYIQNLFEVIIISA